MDQMLQQAQVQNLQLDLANKQADIQLKQAKTAKEVTDVQLAPAELQARVAASASKYLADSNDPTAEFERRVKIANLALKEKDIDTKAQIAQLQVVAARANK